jgi:Putative prokaryotic signal transducing protein
MSEALVTVCTVAGRLEADRIQSWLEAEGIPAMVSQQSAQSAFSLTVGLFGNAEVLVPASRAEEAKALLATLPPAELDPDSDSANPPAPSGG